MKNTKAETYDLITHCAVSGLIVRKISEFVVSEVKPYGQYETSVRINFVEPRKRGLAYKMVIPDDIQFVTIERKGAVLYDSRLDVPCDMEKFNRSWAGHQHQHQHQHWNIS